MEILLPIIIVLGIYHSIRIYLAGREAKKNFPPADYLTTSDAVADLWRWRQPHEQLQLQLVEDDRESAIDFPPHFNSSDYILAVVCFLAFAGVVLFTLMGLYFWFIAEASEAYRGTGSFFLAGIGAFFGVFGLTVRQRALRLVRTPSELIVEYSYGVWIRRKARYPQNAKMIIKVKEQRISDYEMGQDAPFYTLTIRRVRLLSYFPTTFYISANPSQISWVQGGLSDYFSPNKEQDHQASGKIFPHRDPGFDSTKA